MESGRWEWRAGTRRGGRATSYSPPRGSSPPSRAPATPAAVSWERDADRSLAPRRKDSEAPARKDSTHRGFPFDGYLREKQPKRRRVPSETGLRSPWKNNSFSEANKRSLQGDRSVSHQDFWSYRQDLCRKREDSYIARRNASPGVARALDWRPEIPWVEKHRSSKRSRKLPGVTERSNQKSLIYYQDHPRRLRSHSSMSVTPLFFRRAESENNISAHKHTDHKQFESHQISAPRYTSECTLVSAYTPLEYNYEHNSTPKTKTEKRRTNKSKSEVQFHSWQEKRNNIDASSFENIIKQRKDTKPSLMNILEQFVQDKRRQKAAQKLANKNPQKNTGAPQKGIMKKNQTCVSGINSTCSFFNSNVNTFYDYENNKKRLCRKRGKLITHSTSESTYPPKRTPSRTLKNTTPVSSDFSNSRSSSESITPEGSIREEINYASRARESQNEFQQAKYSSEPKIGMSVTKSTSEVTSSEELFTYTYEVPIQQTLQPLSDTANEDAIKKTFQNIIESFVRNEQVKIESTISSSKDIRRRRDPCSSIDIFADSTNVIRYNSATDSPGFSPGDSDAKAQSDVGSDVCDMHVNPTCGSQAENGKESKPSNLNSKKSNSIKVPRYLGNQNDANIEENTPLKKSFSRIQEGIFVGLKEFPSLTNATHLANTISKDPLLNNVTSVNEENKKTLHNSCQELIINTELSKDILSEETTQTFKQGECTNTFVINDIYNTTEINNSIISISMSNESDKSKTQEITKITRKEVCNVITSNICEVIEDSNKINENTTVQVQRSNYNINIKHNLNDNDPDYNQNTLDIEMDISLDTLSDQSAISDFIISIDKSYKSTKESIISHGTQKILIDQSQISNKTAVDMILDKEIQIAEEDSNGKKQYSSPSKEDAISFETPEALPTKMPSITIRPLNQSQRRINKPDPLRASRSFSDTCISQVSEKCISCKSRSKDSGQQKVTGEKFNVICDIYLDETRQRMEIKEKTRSKVECADKAVTTTNNASIQCGLAETSKIKNKKNNAHATRKRSEPTSSKNINSYKPSYRVLPADSVTMFGNELKNIPKSYRTSNSRIEVFKIPHRRSSRNRDSNAGNKEQNFSEYKSMFNTIVSNPRHWKIGPLYSCPDQDTSQKNNAKKRKKIIPNASRTNVQNPTNYIQSSNRRVRDQEFIPSKIFPAAMRHKMKETMLSSSKFYNSLESKKEKHSLLSPDDRKLPIPPNEFYLQAQNIYNSYNKMCLTVPSNTTVHTQTDWIIPPPRANGELRVMPEREIPPFCATYFSQMAKRSEQQIHLYKTDSKHPYRTGPDVLDLVNGRNTMQSTIPSPVLQSISMSRNIESQSNFGVCPPNNVREIIIPHQRSFVSAAHEANSSLYDPMRSSASVMFKSPGTRGNFDAIQIQNTSSILQLPDATRRNSVHEETYLNYFQNCPLNNRDNEISLLYDRHVPVDMINHSTPVRKHDRNEKLPIQTLPQAPGDNSNSSKDIFKFPEKNIPDSVRQELQNCISKDVPEKAKNKYRRYKLGSSHKYSYSLGSHLEPIFKIQANPVKSNTIQSMPGVRRLSEKDMSIKHRGSSQSRSTFCTENIQELSQMSSVKSTSPFSASKFTVWHM